MRDFRPRPFAHADATYMTGTRMDSGNNFASVRRYHKLSIARLRKSTRTHYRSNWLPIREVWPILTARSTWRPNSIFMHPAETYVILFRYVWAIFPRIPEIRINRIKILRSDPPLRDMSKFRMTSVFVKILSLIFVKLWKHAQSGTYNPEFLSFVFRHTKEERYSGLPFSCS